MKPLELLYPTGCMLCGSTREVHNGLCLSCEHTWRQESHQVQRGTKQLSAICSAAPYQDAMRRAMLDLKFQGKRENLAVFAHMMWETWEQSGMPKPDCMTCVPMNFFHMHRRGFNQSAELAKLLAEQWELPLYQVLKRSFFSATQAKLDANNRMQNAQRSFSIKRYLDLTGQKILLIDDIVTTGATADTCAGLLKRCGAKEVWLLTAVHT